MPIIWIPIVVILIVLTVRNYRKVNRLQVLNVDSVLLMMEIPKDNDKKELAAEQLFASLHGILRDANELNTKVNQAVKFLAQGHKVKVSIRFRGREMAHTSLGLDVEKRFAEALEGKAIVDKQPKLEGRSMMMFLSPAPNK